MTTASDSANLIFNSLAEQVSTGITLPDITGSVYQIPQTNVGPLFAAITKLTNAHLSEQRVDGLGTFDVLMRGFKSHLQDEYEQNRITGEFYAKAYVELTTAAMASSVQYLLGRETSYWQAMVAQQAAQAGEAQVVTARIEAETARARLKGYQLELESKAYEVQSTRATYAINKMRLATESVTYDTAAYQLSNMLPLQVSQLNKSLTIADGEIALISSKTSAAAAQAAGAGKQNQILDGEISMIGEKLKLAKEQAETQRAQTLDTRSDTVPVAGVLGKQRALYDQQIISYRRDAEVKAGKIFTDAWVTMKTIDEGVLPPNGFTNASLDQVLTKIKLNNDLGA